MFLAIIISTISRHYFKAWKCKDWTSSHTSTHLCHLGWATDKFLFWLDVNSRVWFIHGKYFIYKVTELRICYILSSMNNCPWQSFSFEGPFCWSANITTTTQPPVTCKWLSYLGDEFIMVGQVRSAVDATVRSMAFVRKVSLECLHHGNDNANNVNHCNQHLYKHAQRKDNG